ncbi:hypothetical protein Taro_007736 [Colocasia esculenta]|uniref:Uncharacterized protein n=1 Tax=Colocasia esculenta TaxID=4460 RepID=A0A843TS20_COLES|nr:hypothetical protein [Colocasia esculenta]
MGVVIPFGLKEDKLRLGVRVLKGDCTLGSEILRFCLGTGHCGRSVHRAPVTVDPPEASRTSPPPRELFDFVDSSLTTLTKRKKKENSKRTGEFVIARALPVPKKCCDHAGDVPRAADSGTGLLLTREPDEHNNLRHEEFHRGMESELYGGAGEEHEGDVVEL